MKVKGNTIEYKEHYIDIVEHTDCFGSAITEFEVFKSGTWICDYEKLEQAIAWIDEQDKAGA